MSESATVLELPQDAGKGSSGVVRRWCMELRLADKEEEKWRKHVERVLKRYRGESNYNADLKRTKDNFNILWANTETLAPALYNSTPKPDIRRRFRDKDPIGKIGAELLERSLSFSMDVYDFDSTIGMVIHDHLLPGRGIARVKYKPVFGKDALLDGEGNEVMGDDDEPVYPKTYETVECYHVQWDNFRHGPGKCWADVPWIAFRETMTRDELVDAFGEDIGNRIQLTEPDDAEVQKEDDPAVKGIFKTAEVWEIWDKEKREVIHVCKDYKQKPLKVTKDPMGLEGFYPIPEPLMSIRQSDSLTPIAEFTMYETLADELDKCTARINGLIQGLKVRGIYNAVIAEFRTLFELDESEFVAAENAITLMESGGLEKAIWMMPIERHAQVLIQLYQYRESLKQSIYEITGLSDIMRGSTDANETLGAQQLKSQWGSMRLQRRQREVQRFIRDLLRIKAEIIAEKFSPETLMMITGIKLPTQTEKQQAQMMAQMASATGQPVPPELQQVLMQPSIDEVLQVIRSDALRSYRIDIETDSTIATQLDADRKDMTELMQGLGGFIQNIGPAVQTGFIPGEVAKNLLMSMVRKFKLGNDVEDAVEAMPAQAAGGGEQQQAQMEQARKQLEDQGKQVQQGMQQLQQEKERLQQESQQLAQEAMQLKYDQALLKMQKDFAAKSMEYDRAQEELNSQAMIQTAVSEIKNLVSAQELSMQANIDKLAMVEQAEKEAEAEGEISAKKEESDTAIGNIQAMHADMMTAMQQAIEAITAPKRVTRDAQGRVAGVEVAQ